MTSAAETAWLPAIPGSSALLSLRGIHKSYGGVRALRGADFELSGGGGQVHTLIGENGSGKSTLLGILSGQIRPDAGVIELQAKPVEFRSPVSALLHGVAMVSQETAVAPNLSIAENVMLGRAVRRRTGIDWAATHRAAASALRDLGLTLETNRLVSTLRPDQRQMVEIARAISMQARVLILDEPTSSLTDDEVADLFGAIDRLKTQGISVVFVSHRLPEVFQISDTISVLRDGVMVASGPAADFTSISLVTAMVGSTVVRRSAGPVKVPDPTPTSPTLCVSGLSSAGAFADVDLEIHPGEVVGLAGLVGSGRSELLQAIFGVRRSTAGSMTLAGAAFAPRHAVSAISARVGYLPPDRKGQGLVLAMSVGQNLSMAATSGCAALQPPRTTDEITRFGEAVNTMRLKSADRHVAVGTLSGGNQQKVALAKWLAIRPTLLLLDEPTRGVDVAAKADIHEQLRDLAGQGLAILLSSSENPELLEMCDRIVVMFRRRVVGVVHRRDADEAVITSLAGGHE